MASFGSSRGLLRELVREFRLLHPNQKLKDVPAFNHMIEQFKKYDITTEKHCRGSTEVNHMANTYLCLLQSLRIQEELAEKYAGKGERSIDDSARLVGLNLPNVQKDD